MKNYYLSKMPKNEANSTFFVKFLKLVRYSTAIKSRLDLKCDYNDVITVLFPVLLHVQTCSIYKMIAILKQINKSRFKNLLQ